MCLAIQEEPDTVRTRPADSNWFIGWEILEGCARNNLFAWFFPVSLAFLSGPEVDVACVFIVVFEIVFYVSYKFCSSPYYLQEGYVLGFFFSSKGFSPEGRSD